MSITEVFTINAEAGGVVGDEYWVMSIVEVLEKLNEKFYVVVCMLIGMLVVMSCESENGLGGEDIPPVDPEISVPNGYVNYFIEDLSFGYAASETKVAFHINVGWSMRVVALNGGSASWCSLEPASGDAGLHKVIVRVSENDTEEVRTVKIHLYHGNSKIAEIVVTQDGNPGYEAVDLGLSVKWATYNIGAESPEMYGDYYAWGETEGKSSYTWNNYVFYGSEEYQYIGSDISGTSYDIAHVKWGGGWRMPVLEEIIELRDKCSWQWTSVNGVNGYEVTGANGNSIFLPAAAPRIDEYEEDVLGDVFAYWSGTLDDYENDCAYSMCFDDEFYGVGAGLDRAYGCPVRPVRE
jgi:hypothetical protein